MEAVACELKYSGAAFAFLLLAAASTMGMVLVTPFDPPLRAAILAYVAVQSVRACRALLAPTALRLRHSREVQVRSAAGPWQAGVVSEGCFVLPALTVLRWRPQGCRVDRTLLLLPGMAPVDDLRKIRVILRFS